MNKTCNVCGVSKSINFFHSHAGGLMGVRGQCKDCRKAKRSAHYSANKEVLLEKNKKWREENDRAKYYALYRELNKDKIREYTANNKHLWAKNKAMRIARLKQQTPSWLTSTDLFEIECIYKYCASLRNVGLDYHVDHIVPIAGKHASGLHTPTNLQVIPGHLNRVKSNKVIEVSYNHAK